MVGAVVVPGVPAGGLGGVVAAAGMGAVGGTGGGVLDTEDMNEEIF